MSELNRSEKRMLEFEDEMKFYFKIYGITDPFVKATNGLYANPITSIAFGAFMSGLCTAICQSR